MTEKHEAGTEVNSAQLDIISVERSVYNIWARVLGSQDFGLSDNFFSIGGTPEAAARLWREIRRRFGYDLPLAAVYEAPTIGAMAMLLRGSASRKPGQALVRLQAGEASHTPLYCFHPLGGSVARYSDFLDLLGPRQPVYGLQSVGLTAGCIPDTTIEAMADRYAREICASHTGGHTVFLGYSLGGVLAVETAARVKAQLAEPPVVVIIDAAPFTSAPDTPMVGYATLVKVVLNLDLDVESLISLSREDALKCIRAAAAARSLLPENFSLERLRRFADVCDVNHEAGNRYRPSWFGGSLVLFRSSADNHHPWDLGWQDYVDYITIHELAGDHHSIMERDGMAVITERLQEILHRIGEERGCNTESSPNRVPLRMPYPRMSTVG